MMSSLEQNLTEQHNAGNLTTETIDSALQESRKNGEYLSSIRNYNLKREIYSLLLSECADTTTMWVD